MKVQSIQDYSKFKGSIYGNISKGKKEFDALPALKKVQLMGTHQNSKFKPSIQSDLDGYITYRAAIGKAVQRTLEKFKIKKA